MDDVFKHGVCIHLYGSYGYFDCTLVKRLGNYDVGHKFSEIWDTSGTLEFYEDTQMVMSIDMDTEPIVPSAKRRKVNPPGDNVYLSKTGDPISEKLLIEMLQRKFKDRFWRPGGVGWASMVEKYT